MPHGKWLHTHSCSRTIHVASHVSSRYLCGRQRHGGGVGVGVCTRCKLSPCAVSFVCPPISPFVVVVVVVVRVSFWMTGLTSQMRNCV